MVLTNPTNKELNTQTATIITSNMRCFALCLLRVKIKNQYGKNCKCNQQSVDVLNNK